MAIIKKNMKFGGNGAAIMEHHGCIRKYSELITFRDTINKDFRANDSLSKKKSDTSLYFVLADIHRDYMDAMKRCPNHEADWIFVNCHDIAGN